MSVDTLTLPDNFWPFVDTTKSASPSRGLNDLLPQSVAFRYLDSFEVIEVESVSVGIGRYQVTSSACAGHFDVTRGFPLVFPRVLMEEMVAQTGICHIRSQPRFSDLLPIFTGNFSGTIMGAASPGDNLVIAAWLINLGGDKRPEGTAYGEVFREPDRKKILWTSFNFRLVREDSFARLLRMGQNGR